MRALNASDADVEIELLRPIAWLEASGVQVGATIEVDLPELNTRGAVKVLSIEPSPVIQSGSGSVVTGRFRHLAHELLDVYVEGMNVPIGCTERHPFWSVTRRGFVEARSLVVGERLLTRTGETAAVLSVNFRDGAERVYNLEVLGPHAYRVSEPGLLVHNASELSDSLRYNRLPQLLEANGCGH